MYRQGFIVSQIETKLCASIINPGKKTKIPMHSALNLNVCPTYIYQLGATAHRGKWHRKYAALSFRIIASPC